MSITLRSDGRYYDRVTINGKRVCFYSNAKSLKQADREIKRKILEYEEKEERGLEFKEVANRWWDEHESSLAVQSRMTYKPCFNRSIEYFNCPIKEITSKDINEYLNILARQKYSTKSIAKYKLIINLIMSFAVTEGILDANPCANVKTIKTTKKTRKSASTDDEQKILNEDDDYLVPLIALCCGLRAGEIYGLEWCDIDFDNSIVHVRRSIGHDNSTPVINKPKTESGYRDVPLIQKVKDKLIKQKKKTGYVISGDSLLSKQQYQTLYEHYKKRHNITANLHELRHSCATYLIESGVDAKTAATILGHSDVTVTLQIYTDVKAKAFDDAKEKLSKALANI